MTPISVPAPDVAPQAPGADTGGSPAPTPLSPASPRPPLVAAAGLTAMAVVSPLAVFLALPDGRTTLAAALMLVVAALDVLVALALVPVLAPAGRRLAHVAAALRIAYAVGLVVAAVLLLATADADRFTEVWDPALGIFGLSLLAVGVLLWRLLGAPLWLGAIVAVAGLGYLVAAVVAVVAPGSLPELGAVTFVGEVALIVWLVVHAARARRGRVRS
ncbi:MAG: DUF4386 family protein [Actinomycetaceae bacterium]